MTFRNQMTCTATGFIAHQACGLNGWRRSDGRSPIHESLRPCGPPVTLCADGVQLVNNIRFGEQMPDWTECASAKIRIQGRNDDLFAFGGQVADNIDDSVIKEVRLVDGDDLGVWLHGRQDFVRSSYQNSGDSLPLSRCNRRRCCSDARRRAHEECDGFVRNKGASDATAELFGFAAFHAADDHFDMTRIGVQVHR